LTAPALSRKLPKIFGSRHARLALLPPVSRKEDVKVLADNATKLIAALKGA